MKSAAITMTLAVLLVATGCTAVAETASDAKAMMVGQSATETISMAIEKYNEASEKGCAWRDTRSMIEDAQELASAGKEDEAQTLAVRALHQSELGLKQCEAENVRYMS